jgi:hypothetical protein
MRPSSRPTLRVSAATGESGGSSLEAMDRDRDADGRARNARPRDGLGRPLPRGAPGEPTMPDDLALDDRQTLQLAQQLLDAGRPFHAHEVLEARWKAVAEPAQRQCWQALAQLAVGLTHAARGNGSGAATLVARGRERLAAADPAAPPVDIAAVVGWADAWLAGDQQHRLLLVGPVGGAP